MILYFLYLLWKKGGNAITKSSNINYPWVNMKFISWKIRTVQNNGGQSMDDDTLLTFS